MKRYVVTIGLLALMTTAHAGDFYADGSSKIPPVPQPYSKSNIFGRASTDGGSGSPSWSAPYGSGGTYAPNAIPVIPYGGSAITSQTGSYPYPLYGAGIVPGLRPAKGPFGNGHAGKGHGK